MSGAFAKILLFGEHIVLQGAQALAMPWAAFSGQWAWDNAKEPTRQQVLPAFGNYLKELLDQQKLLAPIDVAAFQQDLQKGLYFESNIPTGYGVGSSGALCAALYKRYQTSDAPTDLELLQQQLAQLESFFHGSSSGTDPLICYLDQAIHIIPGKGIETFNWSWQDYPTLHFFVIDTHIKRQTGPWVEAFKTKAREKTFKKRMEEVLISASNAAIHALLEKDAKQVYRQFGLISAFHFLELREFIPAGFHELWREGLNSGDFQLKICGAGGGGFILGVSREQQAVHRIAKAFKILPVQ